ncbi:MAG: hypothetical protein Kow00133_07510 [Amphiplicatus sp.]
MNPLIAALAFACFAIVAAYLARPWGPAFAGFERIFLGWLAASLVAFLIPNNLYGFALLTAAVLILAPARPAERVCYYLATFPALPVYHAAYVPFPGINYLIDLNHAKLAAIVVLGPLFVMSFFKAGARRGRAADWLIIGYYLLTSALTIRVLPFTSVVREFIDGALLFLVPYFAISRNLKTAEEVDRAIRAVFVSALILCMLGLVSSWKSWNFYTILLEHRSLAAFADARGGYLRVSSTLMTGLLGAFMAVGAVIALELRRRRSIGIVRTAAYCAIFAAVCYLSGSRGAWLAAFVCVTAYFVFVRLSVFMRRLYLAGAAIAAIAIPVVVDQIDFSRIDPYGSFDYRAELMTTGMRFIINNPLFGAVNAAARPEFAHLVQGQGIVDFVNTYLQIGVHYGLTGLLIFLAVVLRLIAAVAGALDRNWRGAPDYELRRGAGGVLMAGMLCLLTLIATVSAVSYVWPYLIVMLALMRAYSQLAPASQAAQARAPDPAAPAPERRPASRGWRPPKHLARFAPKD